MKFVIQNCTETRTDIVKDDSQMVITLMIDTVLDQYQYFNVHTGCRDVSDVTQNKTHNLGQFG